MKRFKPLAALLFALALSAWLGRVEPHTDDMGILIGLIGLGGFFASMLEPRCWWVWGVMIPAGIIGVEVWFYLQRQSDPHTGGPAGLCAIAAVTIGVASVGAGLGALIRRRISPA